MFCLVITHFNARFIKPRSKLFNVTINLSCFCQNYEVSRVSAVAAIAGDSAGDSAIYCFSYVSKI